MPKRLAYMLPVLALLACNDELTREEAAHAVYDHFVTVGPHLAHEPDISAENILVSDILQPDEATRVVRFRTFIESDTTGMLEVTLIRSDEGWALANYGGSTAQMVASIVHAYRRSLYEDLLPTLDYLGRVVGSWSDEISATAGTTTREIIQNTQQMLYRIDHVPTMNEMENLVDDDSLPSERITWGVFPDTEPVLVWVRDRANPERMCAESQDGDYFPTGDFRWMDRNSFEQCAGDRAPHGLLMHEAILEEIIASGGVWSE